MQKLVNWLKNNKILALLTAFVIYYAFTNLTFPLGVNKSYRSGDMAVLSEYGGAEFSKAAPSLETQERKFVTQSNLSLLVKDVRKTLTDIKTKLTEIKGYVVNTSVNAPVESESGYITIRIPSEKLDETLDFLRTLSVRVVSENIYGYDVTDQFVDYQARLDTLNKTKRIYEDMLAKAVTVEEILNVQQMILNIQDQIDSVKGQIKYLEATSASTLITINLSTDEYSLPYAPSDLWRPEVVFKLAVRSLVANIRDAGSFLIWAGVYSVFWLPLLLGIIGYRKYKKAHIPAI